MNRDIRTGLITAAAMIAFSLALVLLHRIGVVQGDTREISTRGVNILIGLMTVGFASAGAKRLSRLTDLRNAARHQALRRFTAWTLSLGGLVFALAWLAAPYALAFPISMIALGGAVALVVARCLLASRARLA